MVLLLVAALGVVLVVGRVGRPATAAQELERAVSVAERSGVTTTNSSQNTSRPENPPHLIMITLDDVGVNDVGFTGGDMSGFTPNIDDLADNGVRLVNYYGQSMCTPSRATLLSGKFVHRIGLTSMYYAFAHGAAAEIGPYTNFSVPLNNTLLPQYLKAMGYQTFGVGKWNIGHCHDAFMPWNRGFDSFMGYMGPGIRYDGDHNTSPHMELNTTSHRVSSHFDGRKVTSYKLDDWVDGTSEAGLISVGSFANNDSDVAFTTRALSVINSVAKQARVAVNGSVHVGEHGGSGHVGSDGGLHDWNSSVGASMPPLFLWLAYHGAHDDVGSDSFAADYLTSSQLELATNRLANSSTTRRRFARRMMMLDGMVGEVVSALERGDMAANSIVILNSDNGGMPCGTGLSGSNFPYRGTKYHFFEGGVRVPALVYAPGVLPSTARGGEYLGLMHHADWVRTLLSAAGEASTVALDATLDSANHWAQIAAVAPRTVANHTNGTSPQLSIGGAVDYAVRSEIVFDLSGEHGFDGDTGIKAFAIRSGRWKLMRNVFSEPTASFSPDTRSTPRTAVCSNETLDSFLFDLESDSTESTNLYNSPVHAKIVAELTERARELHRSETPAEFVHGSSHTLYDTSALNVANDAFLLAGGFLATGDDGSTSTNQAFIVPWGCPAGDSR